MKGGDIFGENALREQSNIPRNATVIARFEINFIIMK